MIARRLSHLAKKNYFQQYSKTSSRKYAEAVVKEDVNETAPIEGNNIQGKSLEELKTEYLHVSKKANELQQAIRYYKDDKKKRVLILGAGRSSSSCIDYLLKNAERDNLYIRVGDRDVQAAQARIGNNINGVAFAFDVTNDEQRRKEVENADIVISLMPASMHDQVAEDCVVLKKDLMTASYVSDKMKSLNDRAKLAGVLLLNEVGLDPGIDHMECMRVVENIRREGGDLRALETFTGGLISPESDNNPWRYKFTWNPRNVVLAGSGGVKFIQNGEFKYIPYHKVFSRIETINVHGVGLLEGYANRDSLKYREKYNLENVSTFFRGTLRHVGFCKAWDIFVQLGLTDDTYRIEDSEHMTYRKFINSYLMYRKHDSVELKLAYLLGLSIDSPEMEKLRWLGIFENRQIGLKNATPAEILQSLLERKWKMLKDDKDMIVMYNKFLYDDQNGKPIEYISSMVVKGENTEFTAMAKTVGLPLAISARLRLRGELDFVGVHTPVKKEFYDPILNELSDHGIKFDVFQKSLPEGDF